MIVDFHTHTFPERIAAPTIQKLAHMSHIKPFSDGSNSGLAASMAAAGVDYSVVLPVATNTRQVCHVNDSAAQVNDNYRKTGIISFGCMHPDFPDWKEELARIANMGLKGIKLHPVYQDVDLDDPRYLRILDRCGELGLIVLTHAGLDIGIPGKVNCSPDMTLRALKQVGPVRMILAHMGGWRNWDQVEELLVDTDAYLDTSFTLGRMTPLGDGFYGPSELNMMEEEQFLRMVREFGADRLVFGTDSPWGGQAEDVARFRALPLTDEEKAAILGGNAQKLLGL
ncbi:amidohydrolase family protein [Pseudoflavonifractor phocaeensis]|uniref:amidohydrolase family protein n=1 Tax=Pseudoflavonifractor phocaeensis TaxID=1870988 RepID=UPI001F167CED|nr:amidohydrolase family protein [Pseudoflavonifractor phocaeensis]MCF2597134.1 amidohydrolase family protein [Pseudoflavonifractor phocaeensis]